MESRKKAISSEVEPQDDLLNKFKAVYESGGNRDPADQTSMLNALAQKYEGNDDWASLVRSQALYNSCRTRDSERNEEWERKAHHVQMKFWKAELQTFADHQRVASDLKHQLDEIRNKAKDQTSQISALFQGLNCEPDHLNCAENQALYGTLLEHVEKLSTSINADMILFTQSVVGKALDICGHSKYQLSVVAMGSMARGEATPYSDLEFMFLIGMTSTEALEYFNKLAVTIYFLIGNLCETKLKYMAIPELMTWSESKRKFVAHWFDDSCISGFKIDGLGSWAGNIPTGGTPEQHNQFICTVEELADQYKCVLDKPDPEKSLRGDFSAMLAATVFISGDESLHDRFRSIIDSYQPSEERQRATSKMLANDAKNFNFLPDIDLTHRKHLKSDVYRYPSILTLNLAILHQVRGSSPWVIISELESESLLSSSAAFCLRFSLCCALFIRLSTYFYHGSQNESISVLSNVPDENLYKGAWYVPPGVLTHMFIHLVPLKAAVRKFTFNNSDEENGRIDSKSTSSPVDEMGTAEDSGKKEPIHLELTDSLRRETAALVRYHCGDFHGALSALKAEYPTGLGSADTIILQRYILCAIECSEFHDAEKLLKARMTSGISDKEDYALLGRLRYCQSNFVEAQNCCQTSLDLMLQSDEPVDEIDVARAHHSIAFMLSKRGLYNEAISEFYQSLDLRKQALLNEDHIDIAKVLNALGGVLYQQGRFFDAEVEWKKCLGTMLKVYGERDHPDIARALNNIAGVMQSQGRFDEALKSLTRSLGILTRVFTGQDRADIASLLTNIGAMLHLVGNYAEALKKHTECLEMWKRMIGDSDHANIARVHGNIGVVLRSQGLHKESLEEFRKSAAMTQRIHDNKDHADTTRILSNIGATLTSLGQYEEALVEHRKCLAMIRRLKDDCDDSVTVQAMSQIAEVLTLQGSLDEALVEHMKCLSIMAKLVRDADNPQTARTLHNIGRVFQEQGSYGEALIEYEKCLEMRKRLYGGKDHVHTADVLRSIGLAKQHQGQYAEALNNYQACLDMLTRISGDPADKDIDKVQANIKDVQKFLS